MAWFARADQVRSYADHAAALGLELIWPLNDRAWRDRARVRRLSAELRRLDPRHPQLLVTNEYTGSAGANTRPFASIPDLIGADIYPVGTDDPLESVGPLSRTVQQIADGAGRRSAIVLQAFSWAGYLPNYAQAPWPTAAEMQRMRDLVVRSARPSLILWYSLQDTLRPQAPPGHFRSLVSAAFAPPLQDGPPG